MQIHYNVVTEISQICQKHFIEFQTSSHMSNQFGCIRSSLPHFCNTRVLAGHHFEGGFVR